MECCRIQADQGGYFLHEHPKEATSWDDEEVQKIKARPGVYVVQSPMCRFNMKLKDMHGEELRVRKETLWMTNAEEIAEQLQGVCENQLKGKEIHRHVHLIGGNRSKMAQVYTKELVEAILTGLKNQLMKDHKLNSVESQISGPSPDDKMAEFIDDTTGSILDPALVRAARAEELDWLRREQVYQRVPRSTCQSKPLPMKWIDINKTDNINPKIRSRLVVD